MLVRRARCPQILYRFCTTSATVLDGKSIDTIPVYLHEHLFSSPSPQTAKACNEHIKLPILKGDGIRDHLRKIGIEKTDDYKKLLQHAACSFQQEFRMPESWLFREGWTRYPFEGGSPTPVSYPTEDVFIFDVETCVSLGQLPTLAIALSSEAIYGWCSQVLVNQGDYPNYSHIEHLIPLGGHQVPRIAIGHNVGYDRVRSQEPYFKKETSLRFMDTMSMWIPISGMADHQRSMYEMDDPTLEEMGNSYAWRDTWKQRVSRNSLADVYAHLTNKELCKENQKYFLNATLENVKTNFQELMTYCAMDCVATGQVFAELWPKFIERFPSPITLFGFINIGNAYLPINRQWEDFFKVNEQSCDYKKLSAARVIASSAEMLTKSISRDGQGNICDPWMWDQDWTVKKTSFPEWFHKIFKRRTLAETPIHELNNDDVVAKSALLPAIFGVVYGPYPVYKSKSHGWGYLVPKVKGTKGKRCKLERPFPAKQIIQVIEENKAKYGDILLPSEPTLTFAGGIDFYSFPHPSGRGKVGDILSKMFDAELDSKVLQATRFESNFEAVLDSLRSTRFWTNYRERYHSELPVWYTSDNDSEKLGAIAPAIVPAGTVSRRSVHKLWVTLTNSSMDGNLGTGIKNMIQAPPGYRLVGADVDSQEQWLAGLFGDACAAKCLPPSERKAGITPFSKMMLVGTKNDGTDLHTVVAKQLGISRNNAKILNYARLYGSGERHAELTLVKNGIPIADAERISKNLFALTKGTLLNWRKLRKEFVPLLEEFRENGGTILWIGFDGDFYVPSYESDEVEGVVEFENWVLAKLSQITGESVKAESLPALYDDFKKIYPLYQGGYESATFNFLEHQSKIELLRTPVLGCQLGMSLSHLPEGTPDREKFMSKYKRSVMNWLVQSSAVDFLHLLLICMDWLIKEYSIDARFVISIHDEIRYLCPEEEAPRVGLALMLCNMYVRAYISDQVGIRQLPETVAFFSQVDSDIVLRKEVDTPCTNPDGSTVSTGEAWTIDDLIKLTKGTLSK